MRKSNKKKEKKKKDGERNLHFPSCTPDVQAALRERRDAPHKWMKFNADVILTGAEVGQLAEAGCAIHPMKWVDTDKTRICEEMTVMSLFPRSTRVDWLAVEIS